MAASSTALQLQYPTILYIINLPNSQSEGKIKEHGKMHESKNIVRKVWRSIVNDSGEAWCKKIPLAVSVVVNE